MISRTIEFNAPYAIAAIAAIAAGVCAQKIPVFPEGLAAATMTFGVVVAGFTATQRTMLLTMTGKKVMQFMASAGYHDDVLMYLRQCIWAGLLFVATSALRFFISDVIWQHFWIWRLWLAIWTGLLALVLVYIVRNERLMFLIVKRFIEESSKGPHNPTP
ncbi:hypothetical protein [Candidatus Rariloculus sp.]|uniref:hypothetical protein n=1 Tax=Candidatus Rariloculus sp. TaxID=3101265 RepID=UPI003D0A9588